MIPDKLYECGKLEVRKSSFYLSSSLYEVTDDSYGNLIISGTNVSNYPNDVQENVFRLDPIKGFEKYSLSEYNDYAIVIEGDKVINGSNEHIKIYKDFYIIPFFANLFSEHSSAIKEILGYDIN